MDIDFDPVKDRKNREKHGIGFDRVEDFDFDTAVFDVDPRPYAEVRYRAIGWIGDRVYVLVYTIRSGRIRVISLRKANKREVRQNEEKRP